MILYRFFIGPINRAFVPKRYRPAVRQACFWLRSFLYLGNRVTCPCCGGNFRKFLPYGVKTRPNALCPRCASKARHRLIWLYLQRKTNLFTDRLRVLHFAPEYVFRGKLATLTTLDYVTADIDSLMAMIKADITCIPIRNNAFDVILCNHVLEHVTADGQALDELFRVLKPGGWAVLQVPIDRKRTKTFEDPSIVTPEERERWFHQKDHVRVYGMDYKDRLVAAGFDVHVDYFAKELSDADCARFALKPNRPIYHCTKPNKVSG